MAPSTMKSPSHVEVQALANTPQGHLADVEISQVTPVQVAGGRRAVREGGRGKEYGLVGRGVYL